MKYIHKKSLYIFFIIVMIILSYFLPLIYLFLLPVLLALALRPLVVSLFDRLALSIGIFICINILIGIIFWFLKMPLKIEILVLIHTIISLSLVTYIFHRTATKRIKPKFIFNKTQVYSLIVAMLVISSLLAPILIKKDTNYIFQFILYGGDNLTHLELTQAIDNNKGFVYKSADETKDLITPNNAGYPQGLHLNLFIIKEYVNTFVDTNNAKRTLLLFVLSTVILYGLLSYVWARIAFMFLRIVKAPYRTFFDLLTVGVLLVLFIGPFLHFYLNGFQPHILSLLLFGNMLYLASLLFINKDTDKSKIIGLIFILNIGIAFAWLFLAPVSLLISGILFLILYFKDLLSNGGVVFVKSHVKLLSILTLSIAACFVQVYAQVSYGLKTDPINESGYIFHPELTIVVLAATIPLFFYFLSPAAEIRKSILLPLLLFTLTSSVFASLVYSYQIFTLGYPEYYYFKAAYHVILIGFIALPALLFSLVRFVPRSRHVFYMIITLTALLISGATLVPGNLLPVLSGNVANISPELTNIYGDIVNNNPKNTGGIVAIGSCNRQQDYLVTRLSGILGNDNTYLRQKIAFNTINNTSERAKWIELYQEKLELSNQKLIVLDGNIQPLHLLSETLDDTVVIKISKEVIPSTSTKCPSAYTGSVKPIRSKALKPF